MTSAAPQSPELPTQYAPAEVEGPLYERWEQRGYFTADPSSDKPPYSIVIPPPNVTGSLHLGHALQHTMMDALSRRARMRGFDVLWLPGMDHASIAVHALVERHLSETEGKGRFDYTREQFVAKAWEWKERYGGQILDQMRRLGDGVDWTRERFTMDEGLSRAVQTIFKTLYDNDLIYRAERIINWCPRDLTALSDAEVDHTDEPGELVSIRYGEGDTSIVVATTRAETMLGDTAVAVHPDDERYKHLIGKSVSLPLTNRKIPVIADEHVDPSFGTGAVKVTPAHDPNDFEIGRRHDLPMPIIMDERAVITTPGPFQGLDRLEARFAIVAALREDGRIVAEKRPYIHAVGHCSRCDTTIEPRLSLQWWVRVETLAKAAGDAVRDGRTKFEPADLDAALLPMGRQPARLVHQPPAVVGPPHPGLVLARRRRRLCRAGRDSASRLDAGRGRARHLVLERAVAVLDHGLARADARARALLPDVSAGHRIRHLVLLGRAHDAVRRLRVDDVPFKTVLLTGLVRDSSGKKMSKSKGNVVDPLIWMDNYGADAVRLSLMQGANPGADQAVNEEWVKGARNFCTKLWNATRFALQNGATVDGPLPDAVTGADAWILSRLQAVVTEVDEQYERYEFAKITDLLYHFAWDEVCDWYIELAKLSLSGPAGDDTRRVLGEVLDTVLRLLHPFVPFVTETLWTATHRTRVGGDRRLAGRRHRPCQPRCRGCGARPADGGRRGAALPLRSRRQAVAEGAGPAVGNATIDEAAVRALLRLDEPGPDFTPTGSPLTTAVGVRVELDLSGTIDVAAERARLSKDLAAAQKERDVNTTKLLNDSFVSKAPEPVITKVRDRLTAAEAEIDRISAALDALPKT